MTVRPIQEKFELEEFELLEVAKGELPFPPFQPDATAGPKETAEKIKSVVLNAYDDNFLMNVRINLTKYLSFSAAVISTLILLQPHTIAILLSVTTTTIPGISLFFYSSINLLKLNEKRERIIEDIRNSLIEGDDKFSQKDSENNINDSIKNYNKTKEEKPIQSRYSLETWAEIKNNIHYLFTILEIEDMENYFIEFLNNQLNPTPYVNSQLDILLNLTVGHICNLVEFSKDKEEHLKKINASFIRNQIISSLRTESDIFLTINKKLASILRLSNFNLSEIQ
ncbi:MAG: hypothetical protein A2888_01250 [Chlamydiae bacterium RIFCSPLOWO2_01_FULL_28_7]|nr:MAG: hypothetical protein A2888_01250 [Chlamydiae bacterium RIFCSPLOWO2_01_FULL_28_7]